MIPFKRFFNTSAVVFSAPHKIHTDPTPPSWYQKHCLMYGRYTIVPKWKKPAHSSHRSTSPQPAYTLLTSLPPAHMCNAHRKEIWSTLLNTKVKVRLTAEAMRMIDECGGLDEYILLNDLEDLGGRNSAAACLKDILQKEIERINQNNGLMEFKATSALENLEDWRTLLNYYDKKLSVSQSIKENEVRPAWKRRHQQKMAAVLKPLK